jgi:hypothetical protein
MKTQLKLRVILPLMIVLLMTGVALAVLGVSEHSRGIATAYWYNLVNGQPSTYYLAAPTLTANDTAVGAAATQTLTNKTITSPVVSNLTASKPVFTDASSILTSSGTMPVSQGGTNLTSYAVGDILYASATTTISKLADVAAGQPLLSGGTTTAPAYAGYTFAATAGQTYTFPTTSATLARTDSANTFVGTQTFSGSIVATNIDTALSATTISLGADGNTTLYTVPAGKRAVLTKAVFVAAADAGASTITIGQAGALTDFLGTQTLTAVDAQYDAAILMPVPNAVPVLIKSYAAGTLIKAVVGAHAGSAGNTIYLFGFVY